MPPRVDTAEVRKVMLKVPQLRQGCFEALDSAAACFYLREAAAGEPIISRGAPGDALFFILDGTFEAHVSTGVADAPERVVAMDKGDFFGEIGLLLGVERTSTVNARSVGRLLVLPGEHMGRILRVFPKLRREMEDKARQRAPELMAALHQVAAVERPRTQAG